MRYLNISSIFYACLNATIRKMRFGRQIYYFRFCKLNIHGIQLENILQLGTYLKTIEDIKIQAQYKNIIFLYIEDKFNFDKYIYIYVFTAHRQKLFIIALWRAECLHQRNSMLRLYKHSRLWKKKRVNFKSVVRHCGNTGISALCFIYTQICIHAIYFVIYFTGCLTKSRRERNNVVSL